MKLETIIFILSLITFIFIALVFSGLPILIPYESALNRVFALGFFMYVSFDLFIHLNRIQKSLQKEEKEDGK